jgi:hypothetical protein
MNREIDRDSRNSSINNERSDSKNNRSAKKLKHIIASSIEKPTKTEDENVYGGTFRNHKQKTPLRECIGKSDNLSSLLKSYNLYNKFATCEKENQV